MLKSGDIIELREGHKVSVQIPMHFVYQDHMGDWEPTWTVVTIGKSVGAYNTYELEGLYVVVQTEMKGGGCAHGPHDTYPDGHCVYANKIVPQGSLGEPKSKVVSDFQVYFYQSGCFTNMIENIKPVGRAKAKTEWIFEEEEKS